MKTAFPEHDRNRYRLIDAVDYEENYARYCERPLPEDTADPHYTSTEEKALERLVVSLGVAIVETFMGRRPLHHLSPWLSSDCYRRVERQVTRTHEMMNRTFLPAPAGGHAAQLLPVAPRRVVLQKVAIRAYEACLIVHDSQRARAVALRAEYRNRRWKITTVEIA